MNAAERVDALMREVEWLRRWHWLTSWRRRNELLAEVDRLMGAAEAKA